MATAPELQLPVCLQLLYIVKDITKYVCNLRYLTADKKCDRKLPFLVLIITCSYYTYTYTQVCGINPNKWVNILPVVCWNK